VKEDKTMKTHTHGTRFARSLAVALALVCLPATGFSAAASVPATQKTFATPEQAIEAVVAAADTDDKAALLKH